MQLLLRSQSFTTSSLKNNTHGNKTYKLICYNNLFNFCFLFCNSGETNAQNDDSAATTAVAKDGGQSTVQDDISEKNVVQIAEESKDHSTLVKAVVAGELVDALSNPGPFTVFAPTNEAFDKLPAGTLDNLLKPENKADLKAFYNIMFLLVCLKQKICRMDKLSGR